MSGLTTPPHTAIHDARPEDLPLCLSIYAEHVLHSTASFEEIPPDLQAFRARHDAVLANGLPWLVAERGGEVLGYCYANLYHARSAYRHTLENSIYIAKKAARQGLGYSLMQALIARCEQGHWRQMVAVIGDSANEASRRLHTGLGFRHAGQLTAVGFKFGRWVDTVLMQRALGEGADSSGHN